MYSENGTIQTQLDGREQTPSSLASRKRRRRKKEPKPCHICGQLFRRAELNNHLLTKHLDEIFQEAAKELQLQKISPRSFAIIQSKSFGDLRWLIGVCLRGWQEILSEKDKRLATSDAELLLDYARILRSKILAGGSAKVRTTVVGKIFEDIETYKSKHTSRLRWKLLSPGKTPFEKILQHLNELGKQKRKPVYDLNRLERIYGLGPTETYIGFDEFHGYVAFYFDRYQSAVLECPRTHNAIYVFGKNWQPLSRLTKSELLQSHPRELERIIHTQGWFFRLTKLLAERKSR